MEGKGSKGARGFWEGRRRERPLPSRSRALRASFFPSPPPPLPPFDARHAGYERYDRNFAASSPGRGQRVVFLGKTLESRRASLHPGV